MSGLLTGVMNAATRSRATHACMANPPPATFVHARRSDLPLDLAAGAQPAIFTLLKPFKAVIDGTEVDISGIEMRELGTADLTLLDQFRGQPVALAQNVVAALCDMTVDQVRELDLEDFTMLASDVLWQIEQITEDLGLRADLFLEPRSEEAACPEPLGASKSVPGDASIEAPGL